MGPILLAKGADTRVSLPPGTIRLHPAMLAEAVAGLVESMFAARGLNLGFRTAPRVPPVEAHGDMLAQALLILLENALEHARKEVFVEVDSAGEAGSDASRFFPAVVELSVADDGPGLTREALASALEGSVLSVPSGVYGFRGLGRGLPTCRQIVLRHRGGLAVFTEPGRGARFSIRLPADGV